MLELWNKISNIGVHPRYDANFVRRIKLTNQLTFVTVSVYFLAGFNNLSLGEYFSFFLLEILSLVLLLGFLLNHLKKHTLATHFVLILNNLAITFFNFYTHITASAFIFYFPLILAVSFVIDFKNKRAMLFHFLLPMTMITLVMTVDHSILENTHFTPAQNKQLFAFDLIAGALSIGFFIYVINKGNEEQHEQLLFQLEEKKRNELKISQALQEKEILLAEIHHRVKNNLAIITSLLNLQSEKIVDETAKSLLTESRNRVMSMALIHDKLYRNEVLSNINYGFYLNELVYEIHHSYTALIKKQVEIILNLSEVYLNVNYAIPCGLIINEVLTNCYKHAFNDMHSGQISVQLKKENELITIVVADNGNGKLNQEIKPESLGMEVIKSLVKQIDASYSFSTHSGTCFKMSFVQKEK
ncbi:MAG: sensor histidine kinase [Bacteroidetes bacterium]|nr:sensor histidine kinase [Bacteroidota bacterium]